MLQNISNTWKKKEKRLKENVKKSKEEKTSKICRVELKNIICLPFFFITAHFEIRTETWGFAFSGKWQPVNLRKFSFVFFTFCRQNVRKFLKNTKKRWNFVQKCVFCRFCVKMTACWKRFALHANLVSDKNVSAISTVESGYQSGQ